MIKILSFFSALFLMIFVVPNPGYGQENNDSKGGAKFYSLPAHTDKDGVVDESFDDNYDGYDGLTLKNLSKAYWAVGALDLDNDDAIDNYLLINECDLYAKYFSDDFEWQKIRKQMRDTLPKTLDRMPTKFAAILEIDLGKYDLNTKTYEVVPESQQNSVQKIEIVTNSETSICDYTGEINQYPRNIIVILNRPFTLTSVPVDPAIAELYNLEQRLNKKSIYLNNNKNIYKREAYLRLKIKLMRYKETIRIYGESRSVIYADLDGWEVYADPELTKPLYISNLNDKKNTDRKKLKLPYNILDSNKRGGVQLRSGGILYQSSGP